MTTTEFSLGVLNNDPPEIESVVALDKAEHDRIRESCFRVVLFLEHQSFALVVRNYRALTAMFETVRGLRITGNVEPMRTAFFELQLTVLDWLLATRLFLDHTRYELCDNLGEESDGVNAWDDARRSEHTEHVGYRVLYEMRDYCAHRGMPPLNFHAAADISGSRTFDVTLDPSNLLDSFDWKKHARRDLQAMSGPVHFVELAEEFMACLTRVAELAQRKLAPDIVADARGLLGIAERVSDLAGHPTVFSMRFESSISAPTQVTPTPLPLDAAQLVLSLFEA